MHIHIKIYTSIHAYMPTYIYYTYSTYTIWATLTHDVLRLGVLHDFVSLGVQLLAYVVNIQLVLHHHGLHLLSRFHLSNAAIHTNVYSKLIRIHSLIPYILTLYT